LAEQAGIPVWCEDEAGPYQAIPQPGESWQQEGQPAYQPHEYIRGGTAKMLTLFHPATGQVRALPVGQSTNAVLHPWLKEELTQILSELPALEPESEAAWGRHFRDWRDTDEATSGKDWPLVRLIVVLDNLVGHYTPSLVVWCILHGIVLLYTPLGGSWLNLCESVQRILVRRALSGQHPESAAEIQEWLSATVRGWNADPTPFCWGGKRWERRERFRARHRLGGSCGYTYRPVRRRWQTDDRSVANGRLCDK
jgi:hypothetical protein